ncbi:MAG TPA: hypothetical protein VFU41_05560 [Gemmatimonadales bacterium]|nr:hypothetical protein [Gemmatimonadales bacterium]
MRSTLSGPAALLLAALQLPGSHPATSVQSEPFVVEYYYKARWGYAAEFLRLYQKNHFPVLKRQMELGRITEVSTVAPRYHATEEGRWDYRVTIVWKSMAAAGDSFPQAELRRLFPDQETFQREEQRRFEVLLAHWDVPIVKVDLTK